MSANLEYGFTKTMSWINEGCTTVTVTSSPDEGVRINFEEEGGEKYEEFLSHTDVVLFINALEDARRHQLEQGE